MKIKKKTDRQKLRNIGGKLHSLCLGVTFIWAGYISFSKDFFCTYRLSITLIPAFFFIFFGYKEFYFDENQVVIFFPLAPFRKTRIIKIQNLTKVSFRAYDGGGYAWEFIGIHYSKFPFYTEIHLPKDLTEIKTFFETIAVNGTCKVVGKDKQNRFIIEHLKSLNIEHKLNFL